MLKTRLGWIFLPGFALTFLMLSCAVRTPPPVPITEAAQRAEILSRIRESQEALHSLKVSGTFALTYQGMYHRLKYGAVYENPDRLRMDIYILFGKLANSLVVANDSLLNYSAMTNEYLQTALSDSLLNNRVPLPFRPGDFLPIFTAHAALPPDNSEITLERQGKLLNLFWHWHNHHYRASYHHDKYYLRELAIQNSAGETIRLVFSEYRPVNNVYRPGSAKLTHSHHSDYINVTFQKQTVNPEVNPGVFLLDIPPDARKIDLILNP